VEIGYTQSISRLSQEAIGEKLQRTMKNYYKLGEILSDKLQEECGSHVNRYLNSNTESWEKRKEE
jgi:hypothetical protein